MNTPSFKLCPACGVWIDSYGRCNCNSRVNWNSRYAAIVLALLLALAPMLPAKAQDAQPPSVGEPPTVAVEHKVFLPYVAVSDDVSGQGRYWGGVAQYVSWCPSCSPRRQP